MGNCMTQEMPQPQQMRRAPDSEYEVKSLAEETKSVANTPTTTIESDEEHSPNGYPSDENENPETKDPKSSDDPRIEEPPPIKRVKHQSPEEDTKNVFSSDDAISTDELKKELGIVLPPSTKSDDKKTSVDNQKAIKKLGMMEVDQPSDTDSMSMSSQASREVEPRALQLEKPQKTRTSNSTFKKSTGLFLCLLGILAGSIVMNQSNKRRDIQSFLIQKKQLPVKECTGSGCQFLNWVNAQNGLCSLDRNKPVSHERHTLCPPYSSNSTLPKASAPLCNFVAWLDDQNKIDECSLDVDKKIAQLWSKYTSFDFLKSYLN